MNKLVIVFVTLLIVSGIGVMVLRWQSSPEPTSTVFQPTPTSAKQLFGTESITPELSPPLSEYKPYSQESFAAAKPRQRVLFFHASWCPTCKTANEDFQQNITQVPSGVVIFKTDYDQEKELKQRYAITYQHTFVLVDADGKELKKWNGGGVNELISQL